MLVPMCPERPYSDIENMLSFLLKPGEATLVEVFPDRTHSLIYARKRTQP